MIKREILNANGSLMLVRVELKKGFIGDVDQHVEEQMSYIEKGKVEFEVNGTKKVLEQHDTQYVPSNEPHQVKVLEDTVIIDVFTPIRKY